MNVDSLIQAVREAATINQVVAVFRMDSAAAKYATGKPVTVTAFHGTNADFDAFSMDFSVEGGIFFTDEKTHARAFGKVIKTATLKFQNPYVVAGSEIPEHHEVEDIEDVIAEAKRAGHDGVIITDFRDHGYISNTFIALSVEQISLHGGRPAEPSNEGSGDLLDGQHTASTIVPEGREGYDTPVKVDARKLRKILERTRGETLAEKPAKLEAIRNGTAAPTGPVEIAFRDADGALDVNDGRHRIVVAAERGETIEVYIDGADAEKLKAAVDAEPDGPADLLDGQPTAVTIVPEGRDNQVKTAKGTKVSTKFAVVEASDLIVSHDENGNENPLYPQVLQPRDRGRTSSQVWVQKTSRDLDPDMLGRTRRADTGAPIVGPDGIVESGNGRTMAIRAAYKEGRAGEYREWLMEEAPVFGLNPEKIKAMREPVLVRVRTSEVDRAAFAVEANQDDKLSMTATEKARSDARRLTPELMERFNPGANGDLLAASNRDFLRGFLDSLGDAEAAQYVTSSGQPTGTLIARVQAAIFAKAYEDERLLELMADTAKPEIQNIITALNAAAPEFIKARNESKVGATEAAERLADGIELSLDQQAVKAVIDATNVVRAAREADMQVHEYVAQMGLFGDVPAEIAALAIFIAKNNRSSKRMAVAFKAMAEFVHEEMIRGQNFDMFGERRVDMLQVIEAANRAIEREYGEGQFSIEAPPPQQSGGLFESSLYGSIEAAYFQ